MSVVVVSNYYLPNNTIFFENDIITMITWPLTVCHVTALSAHPAFGSVGNACLQWKMQTHGCGNSQKGFTAVSTWIPFVLLPLTFSEVFSSKTLYTCLKCNFLAEFHSCWLQNLTPLQGFLALIHLDLSWASPGMLGPRVFQMPQSPIWGARTAALNS